MIRKVSVSIERNVYTYGYLRSAADWSLEQAQNNKEGSFYNCMSSIVLSAFCIEAYLNHIGSEILPYWDEDIKKGLSTKNKLKIICHSVNFAPDYSHRPFQSFKGIEKYRNLMAHAASEKISHREVQILHEGEQRQYPKTWWEEHSNTEVAQRWLEDTEAMINQIHNASGKGITAFGVLSIGGHSGKIIE